MEKQAVETVKEISKMNIFEKLSEITNELNSVAKNLNVGEGKFSYKATSEADILAAVKPLEHKYRVYSYPFSREIIVDKETITKNGTINQFIRNETIYRFINIDNPTDFIDMKVWGDGVDSSDKAPGKAMTYADKYALLKGYKIITGDDPDQKISEEHVKQDEKPKDKGTVETKKATDKQIEIIKEFYDLETIGEKILPHYKVKGLNDLTLLEASQIIANAQRKNGVA